MPFFRKAVAHHLGVGKNAIVDQLAKRQEGKFKGDYEPIERLDYGAIG